MFDFDDTFELEPDEKCLYPGTGKGAGEGEPRGGSGASADDSGLELAIYPGQALGADVCGQEAPPKIAVEVEVEIRHVFSAEFEAKAADHKLGVLGILVLVDLCAPAPATERLAMNFVDALHCAHARCRDAFAANPQPGAAWLAFSGRVLWIFKFLAGFARLRFEARACAVFQALIDLLVGPAASVAALASAWCSAALDGDAQKLLQAQQGLQGLLQACAKRLKEAMAMLTTPDRVSRIAAAAALEHLVQRLLRPVGAFAGDLAEEWAALSLLPAPSRLHVMHLPEQLGPKVLLEMRTALVDPILQSEAVHLRENFRQSCIGVARQALSTKGHLAKQEDFLEPHVELREMRHDRFWVSSHAVLRKLCRGIDEPLSRLRPPPGVVLSRASSLQVGEKVFAFYDANQHPDGFRYVCVRKWPTAFPILGLTSGWLPARVLGPIVPDDWLAEGYGRVRVLFDADFCDPVGLNWLLCHSAKDKKDFDPRQLLAEAEIADVRVRHQGQRRRLSSTYCRGMELVVPVGLIRHVEPPEPLLSVVCFRWYDYWSDVGLSDYMVTNDGMLAELLSGPCSARRQLPGEYEVFTAFVKDTENLGAISPHSLRSLLRGRNLVAWYFMWPVVCGKGARDAGSVGEREFFANCQRMERAGIRTGWPHASHVYRQLSGKLWVPQMCLNREFRVPPTTRVHFSEFQRQPREAATRALRQLMRLRATVWGREAVAFDEFRGVAKLGFSWCGGDVLPFQGVDSLVNALERLFQQPQCEQIVCLVQERVLNVVGEHRVVLFHDRRSGQFRREPVWVFNVRRDRHHVHDFAVGDFTVASATAVPDAAVARLLFKGDAEAQRAAEREAMRLVDRWLLWFRTESPEPPQCTRIDFLAAHGRDGRSEVWTCEVGECGASLCSVEVHGRNAAAVNYAVQRDRSGRFPMPLPKTMPRNYGWKS